MTENEGIKIHAPFNWSLKASSSSYPNFRKLIIRDKEDYYILIKGTNQQQEITIVNINAPNVGILNCIKQKPHKRTRRHQYNHRGGDFSTPLSQIYRSTRQKKINKYQS